MAIQLLRKNRNNDNILLSNRRHPTFLITNQIREEIHKFFERDNVSRLCPGKKDCLKGRKTKAVASRNCEKIASSILY